MNAVAQLHYPTLSLPTGGGAVWTSWALCCCCEWQLALLVAQSSCAVLIKLCEFVLSRVDSWSKHRSLCHQWPVIQLLFCGTKSSISCQSFPFLHQDLLWINCALILWGCHPLPPNSLNSSKVLPTTSSQSHFVTFQLSIYSSCSR